MTTGWYSTMGCDFVMFFIFLTLKFIFLCISMVGHTMTSYTTFFFFRYTLFNVDIFFFVFATFLLFLRMRSKSSCIFTLRYFLSFMNEIWYIEMKENFILNQNINIRVKPVYNRPRVQRKPLFRDKFFQILA